MEDLTSLASSENYWQCIPPEISIFIFQLLDAKSLTRVQFVNKHFYGLCWDDSLHTLQLFKKSIRSRLRVDKERKKLEDKCLHIGEIYLARKTATKISLLYTFWLAINVAQYISILLVYGNFILPNFKDTAFQHGCFGFTTGSKQLLILYYVAFLSFMILQIVCFYPTLSRIVLAIRPFFFQPFKLSAEAGATIEPVLSLAFIILIALSLPYDQTNPVLIAGITIAGLSFFVPIIASVKIAWCNELLSRMYPDRAHQAKLHRLEVLHSLIRKASTPCGKRLKPDINKIDELRKYQIRNQRNNAAGPEAV